MQQQQASRISRGFPKKPLFLNFFSPQLLRHCSAVRVGAFRLRLRDTAAPQLLQAATQRRGESDHYVSGLV